MTHNLLSGCFGLVFLACNGIAWADDILLPAGTLLRCTLDEPNFSPKTADVGDPVLCRTNAFQHFGRPVFPRGAYLMGHLDADKQPGRFFGKGSLRLNFDRVGLMNTELPVSGKLIAVRGYRVNRQGEIIGHGHAKRDAVEWLLPPLWPWKVLALPARGPQPTLKGEVPITVRLMDTLVVSEVSEPSRPSLARPSLSRPSPTSFSRPGNSSVSYLPPGIPVAERQLNQGYTVAPAPSPAAESNYVTSQQRPQLTLLVLRNETIYAATDYWIDDDGRLIYTLSDGIRRTADLSDVDWGRTTRLNAERGVRVSLRSGRPGR
ncbi:MAG TPA: hypothetical protein VNH18_20150 [Bryobacteraceae bacterium]|nr:hypothetical protein [Bryobacteraceae bacterium]